MFTSWALAELISKGVTYLSMLAVPGGFLVFMLAGRHRLDAGTRQALLSLYLIPACLLGIVAVSMFFLIQVGDINQRGLAGMLDRDMGALLASTTLGDGLQWRLNGFVLALVAGGLAWVTLRMTDQSRRKPGIMVVVAVLLASLAFGVSFTVLGHVANLALAGRIAIVLHLLAISLWGGALVPLLIVLAHTGRPVSPADDASPLPDRRSVISLLKEYGQLGWGFLSVMLISGLFLIWQLLASPGDLFTTVYGRLLLVKLALVTGLMALGALNKYRLVPRLADALEAGSAWHALRRSIRTEVVLVLLVLIVTAFFTTVVGPT